MMVLVGRTEVQFSTEPVRLLESTINKVERCSDQQKVFMVVIQNLRSDSHCQVKKMITQIFAFDFHTRREEAVAIAIVHLKKAFEEEITQIV